MSEEICGCKYCPQCENGWWGYVECPNCKVNLEQDDCSGECQVMDKLAQDQQSMSWSELAELTHVTQVEKFNFCLCEDGPKQYEDCPDKERE